MSFAVIRLRGLADRRHDHLRTLKSLRLHKIHHATVVPETDDYRGMLKNVEHLVTYGELDVETAERLMEERGRVPGDDPVTDAYVAENTEFGSITELAEAVVSDEIDLAKLDPTIKPVFRLAPARGGFEGKKRHFNEGGALGYRGEEINELIERML